MTEIFNNELEKRVFFALQKGIQISHEPLAQISLELQISETEIASMCDSFRNRGLVRRFGAVFEPSKIGYKSVLCAVSLDDKSCSDFTDNIQRIKGITHCYTRHNKYNVWFTFTAQERAFSNSLDKLRRFVSSEILEFHSVRKFKTEVIFNLGLLSEIKQTHAPATNISIEFDTQDLELAKTLYDISLSENALKAIDENSLSRLKSWKNSFALKRIGLIPYHRSIGYKANAMCVWNVKKEQIEPAGKKLSLNPQITHCYERKTEIEKFPFNLFAMLHASTDSELRREFDKMSDEAGLRNGEMLTTLSEIKKTSFYP